MAFGGYGGFGSSFGGIYTGGVGAPYITTTAPPPTIDDWPGVVNDPPPIGDPTGPGGVGQLPPPLEPPTATKPDDEFPSNNDPSQQPPYLPPPVAIPPAAPDPDPEPTIDPPGQPPERPETKLPDEEIAIGRPHEAVAPRSVQVAGLGAGAQLVAALAGRIRRRRGGGVFLPSVTTGSALGRFGGR